MENDKIRKQKTEIMKTNNIISALSGLLMLVGLTGCEDEKQLIIIDEELPIKTSSLYMVGDATPNGWNIDSPTPLTATGEDPLVFTWEGPLNVGEMKLCLATGNWDNPFIRPTTAGEEINKSGLTDVAFTMHAGDPDDKWKVSEAGIYNLRFDLRNRRMSAVYVREQDAPVIEPIETDALYLVGSFNDWNIDSPAQLEKKSDFLFVYEGPLVVGEIKACLETGSWDVPFIRPKTDGVKIDRNGVESEDFVFTASPDNKWKVEEPGIYRLTFDLSNWTIAAEYTGDYKPAARLFMIGSATEGGWSLDAATVIEASADNDKLFVWEGELGRGTFKASLVKDFGAPFYRPATPDCEVSDKGVASNQMVFTESPDDQWLVTVAGKYRLTFNTAEMTFDAEYLEAGPEKLPSLYMIGSATAGGWSWDAATEITTTVENMYVWEGELNEGTFKASLVKDFGASFYRPATPDCEVSENGVADPGMVFTTEPDDQWKVVKAGKYRLTFNTADMTFDAEYLEAGPEKLPSLYMIGSATAGGWSWDAATEIAATAENMYVWEGELNEGTFKASLVKDFGASFYRPAIADCEVSENGVADPGMVFTTDPDDQWKVVKAGKYRLTFNTADMTFDAEYLVSSAKPLYILGDATPGGWSQDDAAQLTPVDGRDGEYTWTGTLKTGHMKAFSDKDPNWGQNFYRPSKADVEISKSGVAASDMVFTNSPDDQWQVVDEGEYRLTLDIEAMTIRAEFLN